MEIFRKNTPFLKKSLWDVESLSDNSPDSFPPKNRFVHKIVKPPHPLPPFLKKNIKLNIFPGINFFQEKFIWADKDTILTICFQFQKTSAERLEKVYKTMIQPKKDRLPKKNPPDL